MEIKMLKELDRLSSKRDSKNKNCLFRNYDSEKCNDEPLIKSHSISNSIFKEIKEPLVSVEIITKDRKDTKPDKYALTLISTISYELQYKKPLLYLGNNKKFNSIKSVKIKNNKVLGEK